MKRVGRWLIWPGALIALVLAIGAVNVAMVMVAIESSQAIPSTTETTPNPAADP